MQLYDLIYADPPWAYSNTATRGSADKHYPTMSLQEIKGLDLPAKENAVLFLWSTSALLPEALQVMQQWNFKYKTSIIWNKELIGLGNYVRNQHEILLLGLRGKVPCPPPPARVPSIIVERRCRHSQKPEKAYLLIEGMYPGLSKLEMFARCRRDGWDSIGNEIDGQNT